jgi:ABC-2 type transport system permease protein
MEAQVLNNIKKMLSLEWALFKLSAITDLQMTFNLSIQFWNDIIWYLVQIILFESLYLNVGTLGAWGVSEMRVFLGILFLVDALQMIFFAHNFDVFSEKIARKDLDLILLRPVSSQQLMTSQRLQCGYIFNALFAFCWLMWSLSLLPGGFPFFRSFLIFIVVPAGLAVFYSTRLMINTVALLITRAEHFQELYFVLFRMGQRPDRLYNPSLRYLILLIVPVAMIASVPARALVDPQDSLALPLLVIIASICLMVSHLFWKWSLKRYMIQG